MECYNRHMGVLAIAYFFAVAGIAGVTVAAAHRLHATYRQPWLSAFTVYVACMNTLALVAVVQYVLAARVLPASVLPSLQAAASPLWIALLGVGWYFAASFLVQVTGASLSRRFTVAYAAVWTGVAIALAFQARVSIALGLLKIAVVYGGSAWAIWTLRRVEDPLDRRGLQVFVALSAAGYAAFDLAVRNVTALVGVKTPDTAIALVQVGMNIPALLWAQRFLRRRALARPAQPLPADIKEQLARLGLSTREAEVVALIVAGLSHKDIAVRLAIAPDTVKKHASHAYRKLGVENRVQLTYLVQHRTGV